MFYNQIFFISSILAVFNLDAAIGSQKSRNVAVRDSLQSGLHELIGLDRARTKRNADNSNYHHNEESRIVRDVGESAENHSRVKRYIGPLTMTGIVWEALKAITAGIFYRSWLVIKEIWVRTWGSGDPNVYLENQVLESLEPLEE